MSESKNTDWRTWLDLNGSKLLMFARQQSHRNSDAEDLLQEAFVKSWKVAGEEVTSFLTALVFKNIRRLAIDKVRSYKSRVKREQLYSDDNYSSGTSFQRSLEDSERKMFLQNAVDKLPERQKEVVMLKIWGELTFEQVAETLDAPINTVVSRYRYALDKLKLFLEGGRSNEYTRG